MKSYLSSLRRSNRTRVNHAQIEWKMNEWNRQTQIENEWFSSVGGRLPSWDYVSSHAHTHTHIQHFQKNGETFSARKALTIIIKLVTYLYGHSLQLFACVRGNTQKLDGKTIRQRYRRLWNGDIWKTVENIKRAIASNDNGSGMCKRKIEKSTLNDRTDETKG